jgi:hypothetical protein
VEPFAISMGDLGRDGEFLPVHDGIDERQPVMSEGSRDAGLHIGRVLEPDAAAPDRLSHGGEIRVLEFGSKVEEASRFLLEFAEAERAIDDAPNA